MKPIEPGCLALIINGRSDVIGMTVKVLSRSESPNYDWYVEAETVFPWGSKVAHARTPWLLRIDGGEDEGVTIEQDEELMI